MTCKRCGEKTPRLSINQTHCPQCATEVAKIVYLDERRRTPRFSASKSFDRFSPGGSAA